MSSEPTKVKTRGSRTRTQGGARRLSARGETLRRLAMESLEARALMAVLPAPTFTGPVDVSNSRGNESTPSIAVDPTNPQKLAAVWTRNDPQLAPGPTEIVEFSVSTDGGKSWSNPNQPGNFIGDPTTSNPVVIFPQASDASVAFDRNENVYVLYSQHKADNTSGALLLSKFDFSANTATSTRANSVVYEWIGDQAISPTLAVDQSLPTFSDTDASGATRSQSDPNSGNVYVAWESNDVAPAFNPSNFNPNRIILVASSDGGQTFSGSQVLNNNNDFKPGSDATPRIAISQGTPRRDRGTYGPNDPGTPGVSPGQVTVVFDDFNTGSMATPPTDLILSNRITDTNSVQVFSAAAGPISDALKGANSAPDVPQETDFPINVNISDPRFTSLSDLAVNVAIVHPAVGELRLVLVPPAGSGLSPITLVNNQVDPANNTNAGIGISGANLGIAPSGAPIGTTFDDHADRNIVDIAPGGGRGAGAPYVGQFRPEGGSLDATYGGANKAAINGTWTLKVIDNRNGNVGFLLNASLAFTSGLRPGTDTAVANTIVLARESAPPATPNGPTATAADAQGIAPTPVIASDNTLGAFSPYQGRLYTAFVDRNRLRTNPTDNTDIFLATSDDGGLTWVRQTDNFGEYLPVNHDLAIRDGYSEGSSGIDNDPLLGNVGNINTGRAQFQPSVAVDPATGTLVMSWLDGRDDAARARVATYLTTSIDGGRTFSPDVFANTPQTATDGITGNTVVLGPIPDNQSSGNGNTEATVGFGTHQGLAVSGGQAHVVWASNLNGGGDGKALLDIRTNTATFAAGPRVVSVTMGPIGGPNDTVNNTRAADGTPIASAFVVTFDRPIDPTSFLPSDVRVSYRDTTPNNITGGLQPVTSVVPLDPGALGATTFQVNFAPRSGVGTYSIEIVPNDPNGAPGAGIRDRIRGIQTGIVASGPRSTFSPTNVPQSIPPNSTIDSFLTIPAGAFSPSQLIADLKVNVSISTQDASSLTLTLITPSGSRILLANREPFRGAGGQDFGGKSGTVLQYTTFDDSAPNSIRTGSPPFLGSFRPRQPLRQVNGQSPTGTWILEVSSSANGLTGKLNNFTLDIQTGQLMTRQSPGNLLDQNANGTPGEPADFFAAPTPVSGTNAFTGPFTVDTLPLILPGPHVVSSQVPGAPSSADNLVTSGLVSAIDVTFDRDMDPTTVTAATVLRVMGPTGAINGPFTVQANPLGNDPDPRHPRTYRIGFPPQQVNGTYTITLDSTITDANGNAVDANQNAGIDLLRGIASGPTQSVVYNSTQPVTIPDTKTVVSTINVPDNFLAQGVTVQLDIAHQNDPDLQITLVSPDGTPVVLVARGTGSTGTRANFSGTIFDDAAATVIKNGGPPFFGRFKPQSPLSALNGVATGGTWKLVIDDNPNVANGIGGRLNNWSLTFQKGSPGSGLGEAVADQTTVSFRIFDFAANNRIASTTWTAVGPESVVDKNNLLLATAGTPNGYAGRVSAIAVDPSDPSGNTVYVGGASGGIWKTTNFLTTDPNGPTYIPLTDFGPTSGMNVGSIAVFARNNDPRQSIIIAGTGEGDATYFGNTNTGFGGNTTQGVGFFRSTDGGQSWSLLDSSNNSVPFPSRDHIFAPTTVGTGGFGGPPPTPIPPGTGVSVMKVVIDPHLTPNNQVIIYAALKDTTGNNNGGLYRSVDTGTTWQRMSDPSLGYASDVTLDYNSATINAVSNPTGNVNVIYAAFPSHGVYISPNRGQVLNLMAGGAVDPLIYDTTTSAPHAVPVNNGGNYPGLTGTGKIVLAKPAPLPSTGNLSDVQNNLYEGWLYAAVSSNGNLNGLYLTKDNGQTWTQVKLSTLPDNGLTPRRLVPSNDPTQPDYDVVGTNVFAHGGYNLTLAVDPTNPNVVYLGGTANGNDSGLLRVDTTRIYDSHSTVAYDGGRPDGGLLQINTTGRVAVVDNTKFPSGFIGSSNSFNFFPPAPYLNLLDDPTAPFQTNATLDVYNVASYTNDGSGVRFTPLDQLLKSQAGDRVPSSNLHSIVSYIDPITGRARLIFGDDEGVFTGVVNPDGSINTGIGNAVSPTYSRNGNLAIAQLYYGASQPSSTLADGQTTAASLFYGNGLNLGQISSDPNVLNSGNIVYRGSTNGGDAGFNAVTSGDQAGTGVQVDQQGKGVVYRFIWPDQGYAGNKTDFFQVSVNGGPFNSRTNGLVVGANDPEWSVDGTNYPNGLTFGNFAINPLNSDQVLISNNQGRVFSTSNQGINWLSIGDPASLDNTYAPALTFGAPDPKGPGGIGNLNNFLYVGTVGGNIFVTQTGGGSVGGGNAFTKISTGLDGSPVVKIIANPTRGSHEAYAVTQQGVYHIADSITGATWTNITGSLFGLLTAPFGDVSQTTPSLNYLTSIQADWRYVIPNDPKNAAAGTHPILYVSGDSGVFRSLDSGLTWTPFPNTTFDRSPVDGGYLPHAQVTDLSVALGKVDPTTGRAVAQAGDPNTLLATTYGRGQFAIRLSPIVFPTSVALDTKLPGPSGSVNGTDPAGRPLVRTAQPVFDGLSEQSAFGNRVRITILDLTSPGVQRVIGGYDPTDPTTDNAANQTDAAGRFQVQVNPTGFTSNGVKTIGIQATDQSGTIGNIATLTFTLNAKLTTQAPPAVPTLHLLPSDDTSGGSNVTRNTSPHLVGTTDPGVQVQIFIRSINGIPATTSVGTTTTDANGNYSVQFPASADGTYVVQAVATNQYGSTSSAQFSFTIKTKPITAIPTLGLNPADDTGIVGDNVTTARTPHFVGKTDPLARVMIYRVVNGTRAPGVLNSTSADSAGNYSIQLPFALANGTITLEVGVTDVAGNPGPYSTPLTVSIISVIGDYTASGKTAPALFRRAPNGTGLFFIQNVSPAAGLAFGSANLDIPFTGDFDGDGKSDLALYRPSINYWFIARSTAGGEQFQLGGPGSVPTVGNFDGLGLTEPAVYNPTTGVWQIESSTGLQTVAFDVSRFTPMAGDVPVPGNYDNTGKDELAVYRPSTGQFFIQSPGNTPGTSSITTVSVTTGRAGDVPVPGNYDAANGFPNTEPAVFNPATGVWRIHNPAGDHIYNLNPGDIPAPGDYTGSGSTQVAVFRPGAGAFIVAGNPAFAIRYGQAGDIPLTSPLIYRTVVAKTPTLALDPRSDSGAPGDHVTSYRYPSFVGQTDPNALIDLVDANNNNTILGQGAADGNGNFSIAISATTNGTYVVQARAHGVVSNQGPTSPPATVKLITVPGDYLGVGKTEPAIFRRPNPQTAYWFVQGSPVVYNRPFGSGSIDIPVSGDFYGDGKVDLAVYRPSTGQWFVQQAATGYNGVLLTTFGGSVGDTPAPADYFGSGKTAVAIFKPSLGAFFVQGMPNPIFVAPGRAGDLPVPGNYDNTGRDEAAIYRPGGIDQWLINGPGGTFSVFFGGSGDIPVPGAYTAGSTATQEAVWRPSTGQFFIRTANGGTRGLQFAPGDIPAPGDYDGIGVTEAAVYRPSNGLFLVAGPNDIVPRVLTAFGGSTDVPVLAPYLYRLPGAGSGGTIRAASLSPNLDLGTTARSFGNGAVTTAVSAAQAATNANPAPTTNFAARSRPRQQLHPAARHSLAASLHHMHAHVATRKGLFHKV